MPPAFVPPDELERIATSFLEENHPRLSLPVPIEEIVELRMGLSIAPLANLYKEHGIESWLSNDLTTIYVDLYQFENMETRYRFTLAHEVSHILLHSDLYQGRRFRSVEQWIEFQGSMDRQALDAFEWQARNLAGRLLVPTAPLIEHASRILSETRGRLPEGIDPEMLWGYLAIPLSDLFNVHQSVVFYRLTGDRIGARLQGQGAR
jgi:hypothetical protein